MNKTIKRTIIAVLLLCTTLLFACFAACGGNTPDIPDTPPQQGQTGTGENNGEQSGAAVVLSGTDIKTQNLTVDGTNLSYTVSNATTTYSMINEITVADGASWKLYSDIGCTTEVVSKTVSLNEGDNIVYVLVTNGTDIKLYTATLRRRPMYTVMFNTNGGTIVDSQMIEEDFCATEPNFKKIDGYSLTGKWDLDFSVPIQKDTIVTGAYTVDVKLSEDGTTVIGLNNSVSNLVILSEYNGITVTSIRENAFNYCYTLKSVTIPDSVTSIENRAFSACESLTNIIVSKNNKNYKSIDGNLYSKDGKTLIQYAIGKKDTSFIIPNNVTTIGDYAFLWCDNLTSITVGVGVTSIGQGAFNEYGGYGDVSNGKLVEVINLSGLTITKGGLNHGGIGYSALTIHGYYGYSKIENKDDYQFITGDDEIKYLVNYIGNESILTLPDSYNGNNYVINNSAFANRYSLTSITIPSGVTSIGYSVFEGCYKLVEVINKSKLTITKGSSDNGYIGYFALNVKTSGSSEVVNKDGYLFYTYDNVNYLLGYVGNETSLTLPENYNGKKYVIYREAFYRCDSLTSVKISDGVTSIGAFAFDGCSSLTSVSIGNNVTSIGYDAFYNCSLLQYNEYENAYYLGNETNEYLCLIKAKSTDITSCTINENCKFIYSSAFSGCSSLTSITIPNGVTSIGNYAFSGCSKLQYNQYDNACYLGNTNNPYLCLIKAKSTDITSCTINENCKFVCSFAFSDCSSLESINVDKDNANYSSVDGILYNKSQTEFIHIPKGIKGSVTIPDTITSIKSSAFYNCGSLTSITIPNSVTSIGDSAFSWCSSLKSVTIPNGVTSIGNYAFNGCSSLERINVDKENVNYSSIDGILYNKSQTEFIYIPKGIKGSVTIPDTITSIESYAFYGCSSLESVTIGNGVISIGYYAFYGCSSLTSVTFENPNGWYVSTSSTATSGINLTLTDAAKNATYLKSDYYYYYWKRAY